MFDEKTIKLKVSHNKSIPQIKASLINISDDILAVQNQFIAHLHQLKRYYFDPKNLLPLALKVFEIHEPDGEKETEAQNEKNQEQYQQKKDWLENMCKTLSPSYFENSEYHAFSAFNVLTDIASNRMQEQSLFRYNQNIDKYQKAPFYWINDFCKKI